MGTQNLKLEVENFQFYQPFTGFTGGGISPQKTEADPTLFGQLVSQLASQVSQLTLAVSQVHQAVLGQAFTRGAGAQPGAAAGAQFGAEATGGAEEVRKLSQRIDDLEARIGKGKG